MGWRRLHPYFCVRLTPLNSMSSNFCHVLNNIDYKGSDDYLETDYHDDLEK